MANLMRTSSEARGYGVIFDKAIVVDMEWYQSEVDLTEELLWCVRYGVDGK
jgi:hypothetical protein